MIKLLKVVTDAQGYSFFLPFIYEINSDLVLKQTRSITKNLNLSKVISCHLFKVD
jgi:hypothetical protein